MLMLTGIDDSEELSFGCYDFRCTLIKFERQRYVVPV